MINYTHMMSLGGYRFESNFNPFHELTENKQYIFASHDRWQGVEASQFKGRKAITKTFSIKVVIESDRDLSIIPNLQSLGDSGKPLRMIGSSGRSGGYFGDWVITSISVTKKEYERSNTALIQEATLSIKEWVE